MFFKTTLKLQNHLPVPIGMIEFLYVRLGPQSKFLFHVCFNTIFFQKNFMFLRKILFVIELGLVWDILSKIGPGRTFLGMPQYKLSSYLLLFAVSRSVSTEIPNNTDELLFSIIAFIKITIKIITGMKKIL